LLWPPWSGRRRGVHRGRISIRRKLPFRPARYPGFCRRPQGIGIRKRRTAAFT
jgi:hypothetical protein